MSPPVPPQRPWRRPMSAQGRADQMAAADLCRPGARRARRQELDRRLQQGRQRRDGDRALHRRPACAAGRAVPRRAGRHHRRRPERRRFGGGTGRRQGVRGLLPLRLALFARRAGAVGLVRPEGDLGGGLRRGRRASPGSAPARGIRATSPPPSRSSRSPISRACASTPSRPAASSCSNSAWCRCRCPTKTCSRPSRPASSTASAGAASPRCYTVGWADVTKYYLTNTSRAPGRAPTSSTPRSGTRCRSTAAALQDVHRLVALLPPALVLVGRGALPHYRRQARADHHSG